MAFDENGDGKIGISSADSPFAILEHESGLWMVMTSMYAPLGVIAKTKEAALEAARALEACFLDLASRGIVERDEA